MKNSPGHRTRISASASLSLKMRCHLAAHRKIPVAAYLSPYATIARRLRQRWHQPIYPKLFLFMIPPPQIPICLPAAWVTRQPFCSTCCNYPKNRPTVRPRAGSKCIPYSTTTAICPHSQCHGCQDTREPSGPQIQLSARVDRSRRPWIQQLCMVQGTCRQGHFLRDSPETQRSLQIIGTMPGQSEKRRDL